MNKYLEMYKRLEDDWQKYLENKGKLTYEDMVLIKELVLKETPKKPTKTSEEVRILGVSTTFTMWYRYCPSCKVMLNPNGYEKPNYCKDCGQHLDWKDYEEGE
jgi:hypothetical protein